MHAEPGQTFLHYRLIEKIGEGGMGAVWKATDTNLDREVAIKILASDVEENPARLSMFETEAKAVAALSHPNIVTIHSIEEAAGLRFITMELVRGTTLNEVIPSNGLPLKRFYRLAIPISDAISAAHERGVIHGDLKPNNLILGENDTIKILDFGLARFKQPTSAKDPSELTTAPLGLEGRFAGTMAYMSPEQIEGKPVDHRSDIFTLGILFYEMATGQLPFRGESFAELLASILKDAPAPLTVLKGDLPRHLDRVIRRCLEKAPSRRVQTALDLRNEFQLLQRETDPCGIESSPSVAVLPFADLSPEKDQEYFCDGIAEEIINALMRIENLQVASRTSSFRFKRTEMSSRELGDRLGVRNLLEGSVRKAGDKIRISVELVNAADGYQRWAEHYDRELRDIFAIQDEIAQRTVEALEVTLSPKERRAIRQVATTNVQAYDYYLRGRDFFFQYRTRGIEFALQMFSKAIELDPSYALAYAGIADCCSYLYMNVERIDANRMQADAASRKALALDPELAEAHTARGVSLSLDGRHDAAEQSFETAIRLNPKLFDAHYFYARDCYTNGSTEKAIRLYEQASALRPDDYQSLLLVGQIYADLGHEENSRAARLRGVNAAEERLDLNPDDVRALYLGANGLVALGQTDKGLAWAKRAMEIEPNEPMLLYNLACIYSLAGKRDTAVNCLETAIAGGFAHRPWLEKDSNLDALRDDARFQAMIEKIA
ncbi:MAG: protein kinase [Acidobacteriota bacterium]|nr:protein kinase [Acidobacteriota bacterium]MDH3783712.1 protein kinase [Acidobacteriota bacterium]